MGHINKGDAQLLLQPLQLQLHLLAQLQIQRPQRLVQQQHLRSVHQRSGNGHALALAARHLADPPLFEALQLHGAQRLGQPLHCQSVGHVVIDIHQREQRVALKHCVDCPLVGRQRGDLLSVDGDMSAVCLLKPRDHPQRGGLTAAGGPQQRQELPLMNLHVHALDHLHVVKALAQARDLDDILSHTRSPPLYTWRINILYIQIYVDDYTPFFKFVKSKSAILMLL